MATAAPNQTTNAETPLLTVDGLEGLDLPESWELVQGRVIELSPTGAWSGRVGGRFYGHLLVAGESTGLGYAFPADTGFVLFADRRTMRAPDAAFVLRERLPSAGPELRAFVPIPPDIAVEVLSPSDRMADALEKVAMYLRAGVRLVWLADPDRRTVVVFTADALPSILGVDATLDGGEILPDLRLPVADLFAP